MAPECLEKGGEKRGKEKRGGKSKKGKRKKSALDGPSWVMGCNGDDVNIYIYMYAYINHQLTSS